MAAVMDEAVASSTVKQQQYWQAFKCHRDPFPTGREIHLDALPHWQESIDILHTVLTTTNKLCAVVARDDSESVALTNFFIEQYDDTFATLPIEAHLRLSPSDLATKIAQQFSLRVDDEVLRDPNAHRDAFTTAINNCEHQGLVIIQRAQLLNDDTVTFIQNVMADQPAQAKCHVVLGGVIALLENIYADVLPEIREQRLQAIVQRPLSLNETSTYIEYSLEAAGCSKPLPLTQREVEYIHKFSQGDLTQLKRVARRMLMAKVGVESQERQPVKRSNLGLLTTILVASCCLAAVYYSRDIIEVDDGNRITITPLPISQSYTHDMRDFASGDDGPAFFDDYSGTVQHVEIKHLRKRVPTAVKKVAVSKAVSLPSSKQKPVSLQKSVQAALSKAKAPHAKAKPKAVAQVPLIKPLPKAQSKPKARVKLAATKPKVVKKPVPIALQKASQAKPKAVLTKPVIAKKTVRKQLPLPAPSTQANKSVQAKATIAKAAAPKAITRIAVTKPTPPKPKAITPVASKPVAPAAKAVAAKPKPATPKFKRVITQHLNHRKVAIVPVTEQLHRQAQVRPTPKPAAKANEYVDDDMQELAEAFDPEALDSYTHEDEFKTPSAKPVAAKPVQQAQVSPATPAPQAAARQLYTVQLMADYDLPDVKQFIIDNHLQKRVSIRSKMFHGKRIYTVTFGKFSTYAEAAAAERRLAKTLKVGRLWARRLLPSELA